MNTTVPPNRQPQPDTQVYYNPNPYTRNPILNLYLLYQVDTQTVRQIKILTTPSVPEKIISDQPILQQFTPKIFRTILTNPLQQMSLYYLNLQIQKIKK